MKALGLCYALFSSAFIMHRSGLKRFVSVSRPLFLNRVIFEENEITLNASGQLECSLPPNDFRSSHIRETLKLNPGDDIRVGILNKGMTNKGTLISDVKDVNSNCTISLGSPDKLVSNTLPTIDLILATPRPERLVRLLPIVSSIGINKLFLIGAKKVEKAYFGSHLFSNTEDLNKYVIEGLAQAAVDCHLPSVTVIKNFTWFMNNQLENQFDLNNSYNIIAHPPKENDEPIISSHRVDCNLNRLSNVLTQLHSMNKDYSKERIVIAIGPEGGWDEEEVEQFQAKGFHCASLGPRILRTDVAVPIALGIAHEWYDNNISR